MSSIRYSERIQHALLPVEEKLQPIFREVFWIYKPRDIIGGDFYWFTQEKDELFLAVFDCTGHGVPGALLSIIGNMLLNEIIKQHKIHEPTEILATLHKEVRKILKQDLEYSNTMDGMEISLCKINFFERKLTFAGAGRPLYIVRPNSFAEKTGEDNRLIEIKGDRKSIGGRQREEIRTFNSHTKEILPGDMIYLTTDGFVDQCNEDGKKFGSRKLKAFLKDIAHDSVEEQKIKILDALEKHQELEEQRDDITLLGVRISC